MIPRIPRLLLGISGSASLVSLLPEFVAMRGVLVDSYIVVMTPTAARLTAPTLIASALHAPVFTDHFDMFDGEPAHRSVPRAADAALVAPATLNTLSGLAHGSANSLVTLALANFVGPVGVVPALNMEMRAKPATQRVVRRLAEDGYRFPDDEAGMAADLTGAAQPGMSKHGLRKLLAQLSLDRGGE